MTDSDRYGLLFELSKDAVTEIEIVDRVPVVRAVNPAFVEVFGYDRETIVGESLNEFIVPDHLAGEAATFDRRTAGGEVNWATVSRRTADGIREFLYRGVPFEEDGRDRGLAIYTDVTDQRRRERHHQVLHRVLRHNLRNDLAQILAAAETLLSGTGDTGEQARRIRTVVDDLEELSRAARRVEGILGAGSVECRPVDAVDTLETLIDGYRRNNPEVTFETHLPESLRVTADRNLTSALDALLENAVEHGVSDTGQQAGATVRITLAATDTEAVVRIADDGPGIPEYERAAVFDDKPLSQLSHGSGLGLWLAKWVVESYGGRLTYERRGGETTVGAHLPLAAEKRGVPGR